MREKLIEFLHDARMNALWHRWCCEEVADYMIANGVTIPVLCKDCKHIESVEGGIPYCTWHCTGCGENEFCSYGEKREV